MSFGSNHNDVPEYENVEDVQNDVSSLTNRMKSLTNFIHNQGELVTLLSENGCTNEANEALGEHMKLEQKLNELRNKKQEMVNLVNELQEMNVEADQTYLQARDDHEDRDDTTPVRIVPMEIQVQKKICNIIL